jgi:hypothetical protein
MPCRAMLCYGPVLSIHKACTVVFHICYTLWEETQKKKLLPWMSQLDRPSPDIL